MWPRRALLFGIVPLATLLNAQPPTISTQPMSRGLSTSTPWPAIALSSSDEFTVAVRNDGTAWSWGDNSNGNLGDGSGIAHSQPVQVAGSTNVIAVATGVYHGMMLRSDGTVWTWGYNGYGQIGNGTTTNTSIPVQVQSLSGIVAISAQSSFCIALKSDGTVWAWGQGTNGELGDGTRTNRSTPVQVQGLTGVVAISSGPNDTVAVKSDGTVWGWGMGSLANLGPWANASPGQITGIAGAKSVSVGAWGTVLVLRTDGTVWGWGNNNSGQLGDGTTNNATVPQAVPGLSGIAGVGIVSTSSFAWTTGGALYAWGNNGAYNLGDGTTTTQYAPTLITTIGNVVWAGGKSSSTFAIKSDGSIWGWGPNPYGAMGDGTGYSRNSPIPVANDPVFTTSVYGPAPITYQWQRQIAGQTGFSNITDNSYYVGTTTYSLVILGPQTAVDGDQFRCLVHNNYGSVTSNAVSVSTAPPILTATAGNNQNAPYGWYTPLPLTALVTNHAGTAALIGFPTTYSVTSGGGKLAATPTWSPIFSQTVSVNTDANGYARVYYLEPGLIGLASQISASASGSSVTFSNQSVGPDTLVSATNFRNIGQLTQSYTVPANTNYVIIQAWGGGGGGVPNLDALNSSYYCGPGGPGGSGAFVSARFDVLPNDSLTLSVGAGGRLFIPQRSLSGNFESALGGWPGGGLGSYPAFSGSYGSLAGGGGGYTRVQTPYGDVWAAGGGGGASHGTGGDASGTTGGSGTLLSSEVGDNYPNGDMSGGGGGTSSSGGSGGAVAGTAGSFGQGAIGGGGGGWYGGGGGGWGLDNNSSSQWYGLYVHTPGGAGSSNVTGSAYGVVMAVGSAGTANSPFYPGNVAVGGGIGSSGGDGAAAILAYRRQGLNPYAVYTTVGVQYYTVPTGTNYVIVKAWGAGGNSTANSNGGAGAYVTATYDVTPGQTISTTVRGVNGRTDVILPNGTTIYAGAGGNGGGAPNGSGGGGGAPNGLPGGNGYGSAGGAGGTCSGSGIGSSITGTGGTGGTGDDINGGAGSGSSAGTGGSGPWNYYSTGISPYGKFTGANGGQGWGGGGGGASGDGNGGGGGGGGGSSAIIIGSQSPTATQMLSSGTATPPGFSDPYYPGCGVGTGGISGLPGGNGGVVIIACVYPPTITSSPSFAANQNQPVTYTITGSYNPGTFSASGLPAGLTFNSTTGQITGAIAIPGTYTSTIYATNRGGTGQATVTWTITADATPPTVPVNLTASNVSQGSFLLLWSAATDNAAVAAYEVQRNGVSLGTTPNTTMAITGLAPGSYTMAVRAGDGAGNWSAWSAPLVVTLTNDTVAPTAVTNLAAAAVTATSTTLVWNPASDNIAVVGYAVYRDGMQVGTSSDTVYVDTALGVGSTHTYTIKALDAAGNQSASSSQVSATTAPDYTGDSDHDGIADAVETVVFPTGHSSVVNDSTNTLQLSIQHPTR